MSVYTVGSGVIRIKGLVQNAKNCGVKIPAELTAEIKLTNALRAVKDKRQAERFTAMNDLNNVPPESFEDALANLHKLWTESDSGAEFIEQVEGIQYRRLVRALVGASGSLMNDLSVRINETVDAFRLNDVSLPLNLAEFDVMRASTEDLNAINAYRQAVPSLDLLWSAYKGVAAELGHSLDTREFSSAFDVAFLVSDADTFNSARDLANKLEVLRLGVDSMKNIQQLGIWGLVNLSGLNIEMTSISEAQYTRSQIQNPAVVVPEKAHRAAGFIL